jgi:hypothetical protein
VERNKTVANVSPQSLPANPPIPLSPALKAAYEDLYDTLDSAVNSTMDLATIEALNLMLDQVDQVLTQNDEYTLHQDTNVFASLKKQINSVNDGLTTLRGQVKAIASHFAMAADVIAAVDKVLGFFVPGA